MKRQKSRGKKPSKWLIRKGKQKVKKVKKGKKGK